MLDVVIEMARDKFETTDEQMNDCVSKTDPFGEIQSEYSPTTPTSVLSEFCRSDCFTENKESVELRYAPPLLLTLRIEAVRKLNQNHLGLQFSDTALKTEKKTELISPDEKVRVDKELKDEIASKDTQNEDQFALNSQVEGSDSSASRAEQKTREIAHGKIEDLEKVDLISQPPQKSQPHKKVPAKSIPVLKKALAPPPPPPGGLQPKKVNTKLKRSAQLGSLYRKLKSKLEGTSLLDGKPSDERKGKSGTDSNSGGKLGFADTLAEMTKK